MGRVKMALAALKKFLVRLGQVKLCKNNVRSGGVQTNSCYCDTTNVLASDKTGKWQKMNGLPKFSFYFIQALIQRHKIFPAEKYITKLIMWSYLTWQLNALCEFGILWVSLACVAMDLIWDKCQYAAVEIPQTLGTPQVKRKTYQFH